MTNYHHRRVKKKKSIQSLHFLHRYVFASYCDLFDVFVSLYLFFLRSSLLVPSCPRLHASFVLMVLHNDVHCIPSPTTICSVHPLLTMDTNAGNLTTAHLLLRVAAHWAQEAWEKACAVVKEEYEVTDRILSLVGFSITPSAQVLTSHRSGNGAPVLVESSSTESAPKLRPPMASSTATTQRQSVATKN